MADRIQELRALLAEATPGDWEVRGPASENDCNLHIHAASGLWVANARPWSLTKNAAKEQKANAGIIAAAKTSLPLLLDVTEAARSVERASTNMLRLLLSGEYTGEEFDAIAGTQNAAMTALRTALAALEGEAGATTTPPATDSRPRHSTNEFGDCPHWCRACAIEARERAALEARNGAE